MRFSRLNSTIQQQLNSCSDPVSMAHIVLISVVMLCSVLGNGSLCLLLVRFKRLRTVPNILIVNVAIGDIINALVNMPLMILWYTCKVSFLKGRALSFFIVSFYAFSMYLTVFSLVTLTLDRYGAIVHGLRYHWWKTRNKALVAVATTWLIAIIYTYGQFSMGLHFDIGDAVVLLYRVKYFKAFGREFLVTAFLVCFAVIMFLGIQMYRTVSKQRKTMSIKCSQLGTKHAKAEVATTKTVGLTVFAFFVMGLLPVMFHCFARVPGTWIHFLAYLLIHMNSMANPIIYSLRTRRFRRALLLFLKDPCGNTQPVG